MALLKEKDMGWRDFEKRCEELVRRAFSDKKYRIESQRRSTYCDGRERRMDISIAERRQGGCHFVVECKHLTIATLSRYHIQTTLDYRRRSRATKAIILVSKGSNCPDSTLSFAESQGIRVLEISTKKSALVNKMKDFFFTMDLP